MKLPFRFLGVVLAVAGATTNMTAIAQEAVMEEIIVTAQKREQSVQDVPIAISAFDQEFLDDAGVDDVLELQFFVPGLTVYNNQSVTQTNINVRGVGTAGNSISLESSVGLYVDGVYRSRQTSAIGDLVDVERVEVLKGPQGTLFGKNTASGAIQYLTRKPDLNEVGGFYEIQAGNEGYTNLKAAVNVPLVDGKLAFRLSGGMANRDGYVENLTTGTDLNDRDRHTIRAQVLFDNGEDLSARFIGDYTKIDEKCCSASNVLDGPGDTTALFLAATQAAGGTVPNGQGRGYASFARPLDQVAMMTPDFTGTVSVLASQFHDDMVAYNIDPFAVVEESGFSAEVKYDITPDMTFTSITAWRDYDSVSRVDADFGALDILSASGGKTEQETITQEFRLDGIMGEVTWVAGLYYFDQELKNDVILRLGPEANLVLTGARGTTTLQAVQATNPAVANCTVLAALGVSAEVCNGHAFPAGEGSDNISVQNQTSWAIFGQMDYQITEDLLLTAGLRYLDEEKDMNVMFTETISNTPVWNVFTPLAFDVPDVDGEKFTDDAITGTLKLSYFLNNDLMAYISYGQGYKSGGTNVDRISPATGAPLVFKPETSTSIEIGMKSEFMDNRLRLNMALHQTDFDDFQANTFVGTGFVLQNAGEIETTGFEVDALAVLSDNFSLSAGAAWVDAEYSSFVAGACIRTPFSSSPDRSDPMFPITCDASGNTVGSTPEWTIYSSLIGEFEVGSGMLYTRLDISSQDDVIVGNDNDPNKVGDSRTLANFRIGYRFADGNYDVSLWAKNLLDEDYSSGAFNSVIREGSLSAYHTEPRTFGITFRSSIN